MLIQLTRKCNEGCLHCMVDAVPNGESMDWTTVKRTVEYIKLVKPNVVIISGGEFTLAEEWYEKCWYLLDTLNCKVMLQSNGWWMRKDHSSIEELNNAIMTKWDVEDILDHPNVIGMQISTSKKFYPNYEKIFALKDEFEKMKKTTFVANWQGEGFEPLDPNKFDKTNLVNLGRGTNYFVNGELPKGQPGCFSLLLRARVFDEKINTPEMRNIRRMKMTDYQKFLFHLISEGKVCKPMINFNGTIHIGETQFCTIFDNVNNYFDHNGKKFTIIECNKRIQSAFNLLKTLPLCNLCKAKHNVPIVLLENFKF